MNKKIKALIALTVIIQLLVPTFLLTYHYSVLNTAKGLSTEYYLQLDGIFLDYYYDFKAENPTERENAPMTFNINTIFWWNNFKYTVNATPNNNVISLKELEKTDNTDTWFYSRCFEEVCVIPSENYSFEPGIDADKIRAQLRTEYNVNIKGEREPAYLSAKIYKGVIIPTGIYYKGEKIISINL